MDTGAGPALTAVFGARSATAFAGVLGALMRGHGYVPLHPNHPAERCRAMLERAGCRAVIADAGATGRLDALLHGFEQPLIILLPDDEDGAEAARLGRRWPQHTILAAGAMAPAAALEPVAVEPDALAYLLFTSGSTGTPKGVMVTQRNVRAFVDAAVDRYAIGPERPPVADVRPDVRSVGVRHVRRLGARRVPVLPGRARLMAPGRFIRDAA